MLWVGKGNDVIRYTLHCDQDHRFDSWFQSSSAFDTLSRAGHLSCTVCGSDKVERAMMAPSVRSEPEPPLAAPRTDQEKALRKLRNEVEANSEYVGPRFAYEARKMHDGDTPERPIWGEARLDDAKRLLDDGIPVAPLPFVPKRKAN